jgi:RND family efflux transporter MFP subunit
METIENSGYGLETPVPSIVPRRTAAADATVNTADNELNQLVVPIRAALEKPRPTEVSLAEIAAGVRQVVVGIQVAGFFAGPSTGEFALPATALFCHESSAGMTAPWNATLQQIAAESIDQGRFASGVVRSGATSLMAAVNPIFVNGQVAGAFGVVGDATNSRRLAQALNLVSHEVAQWRATNTRRKSDGEQSRCPAEAFAAAGAGAPQDSRMMGRPGVNPTVDGGRSPNDVGLRSASPPRDGMGPASDLLARLVAQPDLESAAKTLAEHIASEFGFDKVFIGLGTKSGSGRLLAISGVPKFSPKSPLTMAAEECVSEALIRQHCAWSDTRVGGDTATSGIQEVARLCTMPVVASGPIGVDGAAPWGAWVGVRSPQAAECSDGMLTAIDNQVHGIAACLRLFDRARGGRLSNAYRRCRDTIKTRKGMLTLIACASVAMLVPLPYRVKCDCELQPVTRRFIPVPYDGVLQEVFVEPGDEVKSGQVLARMEGREIEWELAALNANYSQAAKQYDGDLAVRDAAAAQVAKLEMERLRVQMELLNDRLSNLEIKSPVDGVIIGGDPKKKVGARLAQGDSLFEAGPLSQMVAEILVPDDEVSRVEMGQTASLRLDAYPSRQWKGKLSRVSPSAEVRHQKNVFVAEFEIANPQHVLRPGMRGRSRISTGLRPLGWNLFHKAWEQLVYGWGW